MSLLHLTIDPGAYRGSYTISHPTSPYQPQWGPFTGLFGRGHCSLPAQNYMLSVSPGANFKFEVKSDGTVDCKTLPALASGSTITFQPKPVEIDPGRYPGPFQIVRVDCGYAHGARTRQLLPGIVAEGVDVGYILAFAPNNGIRFNVDAAGDTHLNSLYSGAGTCRGNKMSLNTVAIQIDPCTYAGTWSIVGAEPKTRPGKRPVILVPHARGYELKLAPGVSERFDLKKDGTPSRDTIEFEHSGKRHTFRLAKQ